MNALLKLTAVVVTFLICATDEIECIAQGESLQQFPGNGTRPLDVFIWPQLYSLVDVDEKLGSITFIQWTTMVWFLPQGYHEVKSRTVHLNADKIWTPDIIITNAMKVEKLTGFGRDVDSVVVHPDGTVVYSYPAMITQRCHSFNLADFPFDVQTCTARYSSWSYSAKDLRIFPLERDVHDKYKKHAEWILEESAPQQTTSTFVTVLGFESTRSEISFDFVLRRKPDHYIFTIALPCFIITTLAIVGLFGCFSSSGERQERVTMGLNTLLAVTVLLLMIAEEMPKSLDGENQPLLSKYVLSEMFLIIFATCTTVATLSVHRHVLMTRQRPPNFCNAFGRLSQLAKMQFCDCTSVIYSPIAEDCSTAVQKPAGDLTHKLMNDVIADVLGRRKVDRENEIAWYKVFAFVDCCFMVTFLIINVTLTLGFFRRPQL